LVKPSKIFILLFVLALGLLVYIGSSTYKQIQGLRDATDLVARTLRTETKINHLFSQYGVIQSTVFENRLRQRAGRTTVLDSKKDSAQVLLEELRLITLDNPTQQKRVAEIAGAQGTFYKALSDLEASENPDDQEQGNYSTTVNAVTASLEVLNRIKKEMTKTEEMILRERQESYQRSVYFTPLMTLFLGMSALSISVFSFLYINKERKLTQQSSAFVQNVLKSSPNVVSHFEPVLNENKELIDFKFLFASEQIEKVTGDSQTNIIGTRLKDSFPMAAKNGLFDLMKICLQTGEMQTHLGEYNFDGKKVWLTNTVNKLGNGVTNTARDTTSEKETEGKLRALNERLEEQNLLLLDGRAFLNNILKSTSNVVMNLASVRDEHNKIIDFEILFINDAINPVTGDTPNEIKNQKASKIFPAIFNSGVFEKLVICIEEEKQMVYETSYVKNEHTLWFRATAIKLNDGVTVTTTEITEEKKKAERQIRLNEELQIQNSILSEAESLAKVGSYLWNTKSHDSQLSDNFYRLLECEPKEFKASFENFKTFVHPDDLEEYGKRAEKSLRTGEMKTHTYRVITKTGKTRHLRTNGHIENRDGKKMMVGVVQDITEEIKSEQKLKNKNEELQRSNAELESFNRVASHDLQEPVRKIQLFISSISDDELEKFSGKGRIYLEKINKSANRMQTLIKYLLSYSRLNRSKEDFVNVDLNETLNKVLEDLEERITETHIEITVDKLPTIKAITFQMEQLLNNLVSNAVKYRSTTEAPKIVIDCIKVLQAKIPANFEKKPRSYYRLSVMDNGIGFDQENSEKIFGLFERLHQKEEYSGTGIGLAICKKIVDNHKGHIVADSEKGKGSTFCVYLPA